MVTTEQQLIELQGLVNRLEDKQKKIEKRVAKLEKNSAPRLHKHLRDMRF